ncbi:MAG: hypothetical protein RR821_13925, partial [Clostridia bacterium]
TSTSILLYKYYIIIAQRQQKSKQNRVISLLFCKFIFRILLGWWQSRELHFLSFLLIHAPITGDRESW